jgi:hypothetical protein
MMLPDHSMPLVKKFSPDDFLIVMLRSFAGIGAMPRRLHSGFGSRVRRCGQGML